MSLDTDVEISNSPSLLILSNYFLRGADAITMWMMIAGSQTLRDLHEQARKWLVSHGHEADAEAVLGREKGAGGKQGKKGPHK